MVSGNLGRRVSQLGGVSMTKHLEWRLGCQAYTFNRFTFFEAIDKNASLGLSVIEAYPGQMLEPDRRDTKFDHHLSPDLLDHVRAKLNETKVLLVNYGVVRLPNDEGECRAVFDFAKAMGIETVVSEPPTDALDLVDRLCQEYGIQMAIHNHPDPSIYWNPDSVVKACDGRSAYIGACADTGHWVRSGIDPLEAMKKLEGRILSLHLKDVDRCAPNADDVPWGTGVGKVSEVLDELRRQRFQGVISNEYELPSDDDPLPQVAECVEFYRKACDAKSER